MMKDRSDRISKYVLVVAVPVRSMANGHVPRHDRIARGAAPNSPPSPTAWLFCEASQYGLFDRVNDNSLMCRVFELASGNLAGNPKGLCSTFGPSDGVALDVPGISNVR